MLRLRNSIAGVWFQATLSIAMNRQQILLALALEHANVPLHVDEFDERLVLQKAVYLLQEAGVHLGYRYRWHLRGPYSPDLASDVFFLAGLQNRLKDDLEKWQLDEESKQRISKLKEMLAGTAVSVVAKHLELLASVLFLIRTGQVMPNDPVQISSLLQANKKPFNREDAERAVGELNQYGFQW